MPELLQHRAEIVERAFLEAASHDRARARVPSQQGFIITVRPQLFGLFVKTHRFTEKVIG